jgi:hypothetical protein
MICSISHKTLLQLRRGTRSLLAVLEENGMSLGKFASEMRSNQQTHGPTQTFFKKKILNFFFQKSLYLMTNFQSAIYLWNPELSCSQYLYIKLIGVLELSTLDPDTAVLPLNSLLI